jgi:hypothetical protein
MVLVTVIMIITAIVVGKILKAVVARIDEENERQKKYGGDIANEEDRTDRSGK